MGHLNELDAKYRRKGLVVIALTDEGRPLVDKFVESTGATHPIVIEGSDTTKEWGVKGFPSSYLVGPDGKVAWTGHPGGMQESQIEELLRKVRLAPPLPKSLSAVGKDIEKNKLADALKKLDGDIGGGRLAAEDAKAAEETKQWLLDKGNGWITSAEAESKAGNYYEAAEALDNAADAFKGHEIGDKAAAALKELLSDGDRKKEVDGGKALAQARERAGKLKPKEKAALFRAVAARYKGTKAAEKAETLAWAAEAGK